MLRSRSPSFGPSLRRTQRGARKLSRAVRALLLVGAGFALAVLLAVLAIVVVARRVAPVDTQPAPVPVVERKVTAPAHSTAAVAATARASDPRLSMSRVALVVAPGVSVDVTTLSGKLVPHEGGALSLDKPETYDVLVDDAEIRVRSEALQRMAWRMEPNGSVGAPNGASANGPLEVDRIELDDGIVAIEGTLVAGAVRMPVDVKGVVAPTADGEIRVSVAGLSVGGVETKGILDKLGVDLDEVMKKPPAPGVKPGAGLSLILSPAAVLKAPRLQGAVTAVRVDDGQLVIHIGRSERGSESRSSTGRGRLLVEGGHVEFGKMSMQDSVVDVVDTDRDPLMLDMERFERQLYASICRATEEGVRIELVDANDVARTRATGR